MAPVINMVMMPVLLLSGILLPMTLGPEWLQRVSDFMPFSWIVDAVRDTFAGDFATSTMIWGTAWALVLFGVAVWWGPRSSARRTPDLRPVTRLGRLRSAGYPRTRDGGQIGRPRARGSPDEARVATRGVALVGVGLLAAGLRDPETRPDERAEDVQAADSGAEGRAATAGRPRTSPSRARGADPAPAVLRRAGLQPGHAADEHHREDQGDQGRSKAIAVEPMAMAQFFVDEQEVTYAAVDPTTFWRFTLPGTAQTQAVWDRVADGEIAVEPAIGRELEEKDGYIKLGNGSDAPSAHIGAYAELLDPGWARRINAVVNYKWAETLGHAPDNARSSRWGSPSPQSIRRSWSKYAGAEASVQILGPNLDLNATQTALLTGGSVAAAVGIVQLHGQPDGTVNPDPGWVASNIRTEEMPIIGRVTGNVVMLPQLRAALNEVVTRGLSQAIYHYGGCYVPRFIGRPPTA